MFPTAHLLIAFFSIRERSTTLLSFPLIEHLRHSYILGLNLQGVALIEAHPVDVGVAEFFCNIAESKLIFHEEKTFAPAYALCMLMYWRVWINITHTRSQCKMQDSILCKRAGKISYFLIGYARDPGTVPDGVA